jgi:L-alanine-DL-glutamate epimerase-like enolase superfamily enzyme
VETFVVEGACFVKVTASNGVAGWGEADADNAPLMEFVDVDRFVFLRGLMKSNVRFEKDYLFVPQGVGLGVEVDEAAVKRAVVAG